MYACMLIDLSHCQMCQTGINDVVLLLVIQACSMRKESFLVHLAAQYRYGKTVHLLRYIFFFFSRKKLSK